MVHDPGQLLDVPLGGDGGEGAVDLAQVDALRQRRGLPVDLRHRRHDGHLLGGHSTVREGGRQRRQVVQRPPVTHQLPGGGTAEPATAAQPRLHRPLTVVLRCLLHLRGPHPAGQLRVQPVPGLQQLADPVQLLPRSQAVHVLGSQGVQR